MCCLFHSITYKNENLNEYRTSKIPIHQLPKPINEVFYVVDCMTKTEAKVVCINWNLNEPHR